MFAVSVSSSQLFIPPCLLQRILIHMDKVHSAHDHYYSHAKGSKDLTRGEQFRVSMCVGVLQVCGAWKGVKESEPVNTRGGGGQPLLVAQWLQPCC